MDVEGESAAVEREMREDDLDAQVRFRDTYTFVQMYLAHRTFDSY